jgi:hypothetical protein
MVSWDSSLELTPRKRRIRPCGYWLAADAVEAVNRLRQLGVNVSQIDENGVVQADAFSEVVRGAPDRRGAAAGGSGSAAMSAGSGVAASPAQPPVRVALKSALMDVPSGSYYVGLDQPLGSLAMAALEPDTPTSFSTGGLIKRVDQQARVTLPPNLRLSSVP